MKVISQLIRHFWERGALTPVEIDYLLRHGFARRSDVPGYQPSKATAPPIELPEQIPPPEPTEWEQYEESLVRRKKVHRGEHEPHAAVLTIDEILVRLNEEYRRRQTDLQSVVELARRIETVETWQDAATELHAATPERFYQELSAGLKAGNVLLGDVWQASDAEPFHHLIQDEEVRGPAVHAFLALLVSSGPSELGSYSWILKHDEAQALINLRVIHERLLLSLSRMYREQQHLLTQALNRNNDEVQAWSLVLLYNAYRDPQLGDTPDYGVEYGPLPQPGEQTWRYAWTCALQMDRQAVSKFLIACYDANEPEDLAEGAQCHRPLMCPVGWRIPNHG